mmetsp:Transcript_32668/g.38381  ORF Transcript_32668/g.38381 Transcript_32668/m.38381 type:complete len:144 (+) Transcript_32668:299-730(+)|eukprot:CAMPEP_0185616558 /NCGR_PEP_ID=MMETSP0436-20130131/40218_1 /TAXON_ID=626734 ORGANISM="Favella taraikaensis, Strain Fe Narragansett Bay" /NCGR_SAMPLE_ID=MMETSP0436 /ASSEMBLY_ACC=CAM_ASM_000390 /LENGTH=143 /DNA_ID=CAMNT_0028253349 /DNA_START=274 /DNA_END=705 /DNA_ORIENTATION=+
MRGSKLYALGGIDSMYDILSSIEVLDVAAASPQWHLIELPVALARCNPIFSPIGDTELLILAGNNNNRELLDAYVYDVDGQEVREVAIETLPDAVALTCDQNFCVRVDHNSITGVFNTTGSSPCKLQTLTYLDGLDGPKLRLA